MMNFTSRIFTDRSCRIIYATCLCFFVLVAGAPAISNAAESFPRFRAVLDNHKRPVKVVCFGDSVTGVYYHTGGRRAYAKLVELGLSESYPRTQIEVINAGISGHTTRDALARIDKDVLAHKPDLVTVMFGLNDMTRVPLPEYRDNLKQIIKRCRDAGAEVLLCTPNSVYDSKSRPIKKLEQYVTAVKQVAQMEQVPVADCYAAYESLRERDAFAWSSLMSDEIHPNLDGHKLIAEEIVQAAIGKRVSLKETPVSQPAASHTQSRLKENQPLHIVAMPPFDEQFKVAIRQRYPQADMKITTWETAGKSLRDIEEQAKKVRNLKPDLVVIAVPTEVTAQSEQQYLKTFSWILNYSLSFGHREWDVIGIDPSLTGENFSVQQRKRARLIRQLFRAQDLPLVTGKPKTDTPLSEVIADWLLPPPAKPETER